MSPLNRAWQLKSDPETSFEDGESVAGPGGGGTGLGAPPGLSHIPGQRGPSRRDGVSRRRREQGGLGNIWSGCQSLALTQEAAGVLAASAAPSVFPPPPRYPTPTLQDGTEQSAVLTFVKNYQIPLPFVISLIKIYILSQTSWEAHDFMILRPSGPQIQ